MGVDVFFVISGYLISTIIFENLENDRFSFAAFYARRIRRIFPALLVVLSSTLVLGWLFLFPAEYWELAKQATGGAAFVANYVFWNESGYFDAVAPSKPLLHLWSLGIEEQFYIVWPMIAWLAWKQRTKPLWCPLIVALFSVALSLFETHNGDAAAFYSLQSRAWELSLGSILATFVVNKAVINKEVGIRANLLSGTGLALIVSSVFLFSKEMPFPGWRALAPTIGAALVISSDQNSLLSRFVLSNRLLVWIGLISYPLYLWHWPLLSFAWILHAHDPLPILRLAIVILSIVLAWLTYRFVEKPMRWGKFNNVMPGLTSTMAFIAAVSFFIYVEHPDRFTNTYNRVVVTYGDPGWPPFLTYYNQHFFRCSTGDRELDSSTDRCVQSHTNGAINLAIVGDSHAQHLFPGLAEALPALNVAFLGVEFVGPKGKLPSITNPEYGTIFKYISRQPSIRSVVISAFWYARLHNHEIPKGDSLQNELRLTARELILQNKRVYLAGDVPFFDFLPAGCKYIRVLGPKNLCTQQRHDFYREYQTWFPELLAVAQSTKGVQVLDLAKEFCWDDLCHMVKDDTLLYSDATHLNIAGSKFLANIIAAEHPELVSGG